MIGGPNGEDRLALIVIGLCAVLGACVACYGLGRITGWLIQHVRIV